MSWETVKKKGLHDLISFMLVDGAITDIQEALVTLPVYKSRLALLQYEQEYNLFIGKY